MANEQFRALLPRVALFAPLSTELQERVAAGATERSYASGETVIANGAALHDLYVVASGTLAASVQERPGSSIEVGRFEAGDVCGEMSFLRGDRANGTVTAVTDARVWLVPHALVADVAELEPGVLRELAATVASRLSSANDRIRELRSGRSVACVVPAGSAWTRAFVAHVGVAAARHLHRPVLLIDLSAGGDRLSVAARALPTVAQLIEQPALFAEVEALAHGDGPELGFAAAGGEAAPDAASAIALIARTRRIFPLVIVLLADASPALEAVIDELDGPMVVRELGEEIAQLRGAPWWERAELFMLRDDGARASQREQRELSAALGASVLRISGGGPQALAGDRPAEDGAEPWPSVDWTARHLTRRKVGLALGGGGSRGYAHLGVIERLAHYGVPIDYVSGTSIGAPLAAAVADGWEPDDIREVMDSMFSEAIRITSTRLPWASLTTNRGLKRGFERLAGERTFDDLQIPVAVIAADLATREEVVLRTGDPVTAMLASMAIPGIFPPVEVDGRTVVDGGLLNPVPIEVLAEMGADIVIGVSLSGTVRERTTRPRRRSWLRGPPILDTLAGTLDMVMAKIGADKAVHADISIEPLFRGPTGLREFRRGDAFIQWGREATDEAHGELQAALPWID